MHLRQDRVLCGLNSGDAAGGLILPDGSLGSIGGPFLATSADFVENPFGPDGCPLCECPTDICGVAFSGTINGGSVLMTVTDAMGNTLLDFTGRITGGSFSGQYCYSAQLCGDHYLTEDTNFSFSGFGTIAGSP